MIHGRVLLKQFGRWSVGSGHNIDIGEDLWLANADKVVLNQGSSATCVSDLVGANHNWDLNALR